MKAPRSAGGTGRVRESAGGGRQRRGKEGEGRGAGAGRIEQAKGKLNWYLVYCIAAQTPRGVGGGSPRTQTDSAIRINDQTD